jgi:hypothetical protein
MSTSLPLCNRTTTDMRLRVLVKGMVQRMVKRVGGPPSEEEAPSEEDEGLDACSGLVGRITDAPPGSRPVRGGTWNEVGGRWGEGLGRWESMKGVRMIIWDGVPEKRKPRSPAAETSASSSGDSACTYEEMRH